MPRRHCATPPADAAFVERFAPRLLNFARATHDYAIMLMDGDRVIRWANAGCCHILGVEATELPGETVDRFFLEEDVALGIPRHEVEVATSRGFSADDRWMQRWDRSRFWANGMTLRTDGEPGFVKVLRDLTETRMQIDQLVNQVQALAGESERKSRGIALLAHELRNPLAAIQMAASVLAHGGGASVAQGQDPLRIIQRNVGFATQLAEDLMEEGRQAAGKTSLSVERIDLGALLEEAVLTARARQAQPGRPVEILLPPAPITLEGDALRLQQVFVNLVANALKYTPPPGRIWLSGTAQGRQVLVEVSDQGIGIAPQMLESIFGMFTQARTPMAREGLGVGLALVKKIVQMHGGSVVAHSEGVGKGSIFKVSLPRRQGTGRIATGA
ncbi:MAG TPA: PAS domain-containing sensor histidine kinase [Xanthomonadaceae bacterium]|nr:PAS domain-containing sensor histidine kinase [Xanthomonadaceae bacterium]